MLYIYEDLDRTGDDFLEKISILLSEQRFDKVQKLRFIQGKNASAVVYLLLRLALRDEYGINEPVEFVYSGKGKPTLKNHPHIHFNLSHSSNTAVCAVAESNIGVDVQKITTVNDNVAKRVLTAEEYLIFNNTGNPGEYFCEIWTIKESYFKLTGQGISEEFRNLSADSVDKKMVYKGNDYFCCVCGPAAQALPVKHVRRNDIEQLLY